ncbi:MAG: hypothetical protein ACE5II_06080 [Anaerolineae bacterium]
MPVIKVVVTPFGEARKEDDDILIEERGSSLMVEFPRGRLSPQIVRQYRQHLLEAATALKEILDELAPGWEDTQ